MMQQTEFCVTDFGAKPSPEADNTAAFQAAMDAAGAVGGVVTVPSGRWNVGKLMIPAGITVMGTYTWNWSSFDGFHGTVLVMCHDDESCCFDMTHAYGTHLKGISIDGRRIGAGIHGVYIDRDEWDEREDNIKIEGCRIGHFSGDSLRFKYVRGFSVHHSMLCFSLGWSLYVTGRDGSLYDNWFSDSEAGNVAFGGFASAIRMYCNRCEDSPTGIDMMLYLPMGDEPREGCRDITIESNCFCGSSLGGIRAIGTPEVALTNIVIMGNTFNVNGGADNTNLQNSSSHLWVEYLKDSVICGNTFFAGRGFFQPGERVRPSYSVVMAHLDNCIISENGMNLGACYEPFHNEGRHMGPVLMHNNQGREVPEIDDYLFPWWSMRQFPEGRAGQDEKAKARK